MVKLDFDPNLPICKPKLQKCKYFSAAIFAQGFGVRGSVCAQGVTHPICQTSILTNLSGGSSDILICQTITCQIKHSNLESGELRTKFCTCRLLDHFTCARVTHPHIAGFFRSSINLFRTDSQSSSICIHFSKRKTMYKK